jgi:hypothetical protein
MLSTLRSQAMLMQTGVAAQIETLVTLAGTINFEAVQTLTSLSQLKERYRRFLGSLTPRNIDVQCQEPTYATTTAAAGSLAALFSNDSALDDKLQSKVIDESDDPESKQKQTRVETALHELSLYSPDYAEIFKTVVTHVFILPSAVARAGSTSQAIGVIWLNPKLNYPISDVMEILLHEFTHQMMFLDELRYGHYSYGAIADRSTWAKSAILNISRPLDKVLHSIVVAAEVLLFRQRHIGHPIAPRSHPPTGVMLQQLEESLTSIEAAMRKFPTILRPRTTEIVANIRCVLSDAFDSFPAAPKRVGN